MNENREMVHHHECRLCQTTLNPCPHLLFSFHFFLFYDIRALMIPLILKSSSSTTRDPFITLEQRSADWAVLTSSTHVGFWTIIFFKSCGWLHHMVLVSSRYFLFISYTMLNHFFFLVDPNILTQNMCLHDYDFNS